MLNKRQDRYTGALLGLACGSEQIQQRLFVDNVMQEEIEQLAQHTTRIDTLNHTFHHHRFGPRHIV